jgi:histidinol-phosphate aminotransferase
VIAAPRHRELARLHLSESPHGASPAALAAAHDSLAQLSVYPDPERHDLRAALAAHWNLDPCCIAVGNGSDELVLMSSIGLGRPDRPGLVTAGTFPGYRICLEAVGRGACEVPLAGSVVAAGALAGRLPTVGVAFVCNPHNPTGRALTRAELDLLVESASRAGVPLVCDEAYMDFAPQGTPQVRDYLGSGAPVLALRTFSKAYGLAGLRIGYAMGDPALAGSLRAMQGTAPFSVNRVAQAAAVAALRDAEFLDQVRAANAATRQWLAGELAAAGREFLPSVTNFVAILVTDSAAAEAALSRDYGILTRDAGQFGLTGYLRASLGPRASLERLLLGLADLDPPDSTAGQRT